VLSPSNRLSKVPKSTPAENRYPTGDLVGCPIPEEIDDRQGFAGL
jgi:hypothetical protein